MILCPFRGEIETVKGPVGSQGLGEEMGALQQKKALFPPAFGGVEVSEFADAGVFGTGDHDYSALGPRVGSRLGFTLGLLAEATSFGIPILAEAIKVVFIGKVLFPQHMAEVPLLQTQLPKG